MTLFPPDYAYDFFYLLIFLIRFFPSSFRVFSPDFFFVRASYLFVSYEYQVRQVCSCTSRFCKHQNRTRQAPRATPVAEHLPQAQHSTAQRNQPRTKQRSMYYCTCRSERDNAQWASRQGCREQQVRFVVDNLPGCVLKICKARVSLLYGKYVHEALGTCKSAVCT